MDLAQRIYINIFIVGNFNYCTIDWNLRVIRSHSESATRFITTINDVLLEQLVSEPTRYRVGQKENILVLMNEFFNGFNWTLLLNALNTQEYWTLFTDKVDYAIEMIILINDKNKSTSEDWVNSKVRYERKKKKQAWSKL